MFSKGTKVYFNLCEVELPTVENPGQVEPLKKSTEAPNIKAVVIVKRPREFILCGWSRNVRVVHGDQFELKCMLVLLEDLERDALIVLNDNSFDFSSLASKVRMEGSLLLKIPNTLTKLTFELLVGPLKVFVCNIFNDNLNIVLKNCSGGRLELENSSLESLKTKVSDFSLLTTKSKLKCLDYYSDMRDSSIGPNVDIGKLYFFSKSGLVHFSQSNIIESGGVVDTVSGKIIFKKCSSVGLFLHSEFGNIYVGNHKSPALLECVADHADIHIDRCRFDEGIKMKTNEIDCLMSFNASDDETKSFSTIKHIESLLVKRIRVNTTGQAT